MLLDNKREKTINNHKKVFKLYKELKKILPIGYLKTRVSKGQKYSIQKQSILTKIEKEKLKEFITPTKITKNLFYNKNIYLFSGKDEQAKKFLKKIQNLKKCPKQISLDYDDIDLLINAPNNSLKTLNIKNQSNLNNYLSNSKKIKSKEEDEINSISNNSRGHFRRTTINKYIMKNNIFLPSITNRLKNNLPRYERQTEGFLLEGIGKFTFKYLYSDERKYNVNEETNVDEETLKNENSKYETIKFIKNNIKNNRKSDIDEKMPNISSSHREIKLKVNKNNDTKNNLKKLFLQNDLKALKITGFKKINKNLIN